MGDALPGSNHLLKISKPRYKLLRTLQKSPCTTIIMGKRENRRILWIRWINN